MFQEEPIKNKMIATPTAKWISFLDVTTTTKTKRYKVCNRENGCMLGEVKWYGGFRKYSFFPAYDTIFENQYLTDIINFLHYLMKERQDKIKKIIIKNENAN